MPKILSFPFPGGPHTNSTVTVVIAAPSGVIRYTLDGSIPTQASARYTQPLSLSVNTVIQARVFQVGLLPSRIGIQTYTLLDSGAGTFSSNLPVMIIETAGMDIPQDQRIRAFVSTLRTARGPHPVD